MSCPECKDIKYLDRAETTEILEDYEDAIGVIYVDIDSRIVPKTDETLEELESRKEKVFNETINAILKLAIPECKKCKELEDDLKCSLQINKNIIKKYDKLKVKYKELEKTELRALRKYEKVMIENEDLKVRCKIKEDYIEELLHNYTCLEGTTDEELLHLKKTADNLVKLCVKRDKIIADKDEQIFILNEEIDKLKAEVKKLKKEIELLDSIIIDGRE